jgi:hypothetical protein
MPGITATQETEAGRSHVQKAWSILNREPLSNTRDSVSKINNEKMHKIINQQTELFYRKIN